MKNQKQVNKKSSKEKIIPPKMLYKVLLEEYERLKLLSEPDADLIRRIERVKRKEKGVKNEDQLKAEFPNPADFDAELKRQAVLRSEFRFEMLEEIRALIHEKDSDERPAALCLSGGGIRSATFNLGVLQALAQHKLLDKFDYLSTVSGGGYIGSWLSAWIYRTKTAMEENKPEENPPVISAEFVQSVQHQLCDTTPDRVEPPEITYLRSYSNFMSPRPGAASTDTWTLVAVYLRNLLLNWTVFIPLIALFLLAPRFVEAIANRENYVAVQFLIGVAAFALGIVSVVHIIAMRPTLERFSWVKQRYVVDDVGNLLSAEPKVLWRCLFPLILSAFGMAIIWFWITKDTLKFTFIDGLIRKNLGVNQPWIIELIVFIIFGEALFLIGFVAAHGILFYRKNFRTIAEITATALNERENKFEINIMKEFVISIFGGALGGAMLYLFANLFDTLHRHFPTLNITALYICFSAPLFLTAFLIAAAFFVGVAGQIYDDIDREWLSRFGAWVLIVIFGWSLLASVVLFGPELFTLDWKSVSIPIGGISGFITLILGFSRRSPATEEKASETTTGTLLRIAPQLAAPVFAMFLVALISHFTSLILGKTHLVVTRMITDDFRDILQTDVFYLSPEIYLQPLKDATLLFSPSAAQNEFWYLLFWAIVLLAVGCLMGWFININKFSLHATYRERLIRAYLGASRADKRRETANSFTDLDGADNIEMQKLRYQKPFHIVNMTLNLGGSNNLRWQNRKAESFTVSALHCGSSNMGGGSGIYRDSKRYGFNKHTGEAITLGTAAAISGAAASPNMGYFTMSSAVSFLMALFNIRLGWWLGNPGIRGDKTYDTAAPSFSPFLFLDEAFGDTNDTNRYVYLSDGGHFENLGLYEMVLRRCHFIVVCDAGADEKFGFFDFGSAIHKIRVDMGIPIEFKKEKAPKQGRNCAIAEIKYSAVDGDVEDGVLLYIKPTLDGDEPIDIVNYKSVNPKFPHETTADQMYSESQFESYRSLGFHMVDSICCVDKETTCTYISNLLKSAESYLEKKNNLPKPKEPESAADKKKE